MRPCTADLVDLYESEVRSCPVQFRDFGGRLAFGGPVRTLVCDRDNALLSGLVSAPGEGAVLVVDGGGSLHCALVGDVLAGRAAENGWAGLIVFGAVRDVTALARTPIGLKALGSNPARSGKTGGGLVDAPLVIGGAAVAPGDWAYADADGVLFAPRRLPEAGET